MRICGMGMQSGHDDVSITEGNSGAPVCDGAEYLLAYFHAKRRAETEGGYVPAEPSSVLLLDLCSGDRPHDDVGEGRADRIYFCSDDGLDLVRELDLPLNVVFPLPDHDIVPCLLRRMHEEFVSGNEYRDRSLGLLLELVLLKISEMIGRGGTDKSPRRYEKAFRELRAAVFHEPEKEWRVSECASANGLSTPYFQKLYKSYFGNTFVRDVIRSRLERAKHLLLASSYSIKEIAALCGYKDETFFMKQFKKDTGITPSRYRSGIRGRETDGTENRENRK